MTDPQVFDIELTLLMEAIYQRYGFDFRHYARASMTRRVKAYMEVHDYPLLGELMSTLLYSPLQFQKFLKSMSITVTEMFRDPEFFRTLRTTVIPALKTFPFCKIWLAGCSSGQEAYSLAIVLSEEEFYDRCTIFATDFNDDALAIAKEGIYKLESLKEYTANYQKSGGRDSFSQYYRARYEHGIMDKSLKEQITFANHNLSTDTAFGEMHLIICRNVMIYFNQELQNRVLKLFSDSLTRGGFLALGSKESLQFSPLEERFTPVDRNWKIYQKKW